MWTALLLLPLILGGQEPATITQDRGEPGGRRDGQTLVLYEVRDLVVRLPVEAEGVGVFSKPPAPGQPAARREEPTGEMPPGFEDLVRAAPTGEQVEGGGRTLERLVRTYVEPPLAEPMETVRCSAAGTLVVSARPVQQAWVEQFLAGLRSFEGFIDLQARIYTVPRGLLRDWGIAPSATLATPADLASFHERVLADGRCDVVLTPRMLGYPCQNTSMCMGEQVSYVKSWQLQIVEPGGREIADPQVETFFEGLEILARTTPLPGGRFAQELELTSRSCERPIPTRKVRISASTDEEYEVGEPQLKTASFSATVALADGAAAVLVTPDTDPDKDLALVVTVRRLEAPGAGDGK